MNKRIIRAIIYEGDEELVDAYERNSLDRTQRSLGMPRHWQEPPIDKGKQIFITGVTLKEEMGLFQAIEKHNLELIKQLKNSVAVNLQNSSLDTPILNQLN